MLQSERVASVSASREEEMARGSGDKGRREANIEGKLIHEKL